MNSDQPGVFSSALRGEGEARHLVLFGFRFILSPGGRGLEFGHYHLRVTIKCKEKGLLLPK